MFDAPNYRAISDSGPTPAQVRSINAEHPASKAELCILLIWYLGKWVIW